MDLLERYLQAIKPLLPQKSKDDILRELAENLRCQIEEKEEVLGRPLTPSEQSDILKRHGHPIVVAARYGRAQYLIGPNIFPLYWLILRIAASTALLIRFVVAVVLAAISPDPSQSIIPDLLAVPTVLIPVFCWVTGLFAAFEILSPSLRLNFKPGWDPASLPVLDPVVGKDTRVIRRTESAAQIIFGGAAILYWQAVPAAPFLIFGPAARIIALAPVWTALHWPIVVFMVAGLVQACADLAQPVLSSMRLKVRLGLQATGLLIFALILRAGSWVTVAPGVQDPAKYTGVVTIVNQVLFWCFLTGLVFEGIRFVLECSKQFRGSFSKYKIVSSVAL